MTQADSPPHCPPPPMTCRDGAPTSSFLRQFGPQGVGRGARPELAFYASSFLSQTLGCLGDLTLGSCVRAEGPEGAHVWIIQGAGIRFLAVSPTCYVTLVRQVP